MLVIDGVVGVGKSTLMKILAEKYGLVAFREPVVNNPILEKFYHDRSRYSFPLQIFFLNKRLEQLNEAIAANGSVLDRSIYGDMIFAKMLCDNNELSQEEYEIYKELFDNMSEHMPKPRLLIYLDISVDNAVERIQKRGRDYELITEHSYWTELNSNYSSFFNNYNHSPILKIDVNNLDFENVDEHREYILSIIDNALKGIDEQTA